MKNLSHEYLSKIKNKLSKVNINDYMLNKYSKYALNHHFNPVKLKSRTVKPNIFGKHNNKNKNASK